MGCDYYVITYVTAKLRDGSSASVTLSKEKKYYIDYHGDVSSHDEEYSDEVKDYKQSQKDKHVKHKILIKDGEWKITRKSKQEYYMNLLTTKLQTAVALDNIVEMKLSVGSSDW